MKQKRLLTFIALALTGISIAAPQIDSARVDAMLEQFGNKTNSLLMPANKSKRLWPQPTY